MYHENELSHVGEYMPFVWESYGKVRQAHPSSLDIGSKVPVRPKAWTCKRCRGFCDRMKLIGTWEWWWLLSWRWLLLLLLSWWLSWWWSWWMMDDGQRGSMHDDQWWSMMVHVGYIHTIIIYIFEVIYCFSCRYFEQHFAQKLFERGNLLLSKKSPTVQCSRIMQEPLFWGFVPAWTDTSMFSRYIQTRPCKIFSVPTTPENDWNLKIQTSPNKEETLNSNRLKSPNLYWFQ